MRCMCLRRSTALLAVLALLAAGCVGGDDPEPGDSRVSLPSEATSLPEFDLAAYEAMLLELRGTPVLVNIWASWCGPCIDEAPHLAAAYAEFGDRVQFVGVDILDAREPAREFIRRFGWTYPSVFDPPGAIRDGLGLLGQPVTLFYDAEGELVGTWQGALNPEELDRRLAEIAEI